MNEKKQGTALPTEGATKEEAQTMNSKGVGLDTPTEWANRMSEEIANELRRVYDREREQELQNALPRPSALSPEKIQGFSISEETATWISAYTKVQELYDWIYYAYVYRYSEDRALKQMVDDGVQDLWNELADKLIKSAGYSITDNLGCMNENIL